MTHELEMPFPLVDALMKPHRDVLGRDYEAVRNHGHRVAHMTAGLLDVGSVDALEVVERRRIAFAVAFHDTGIWTHNTFDYIDPSVGLALAALERDGHGEDGPAVEAMCRNHHKVTAYKGPDARLVEAFRVADWADVSLGLRLISVPRELYRGVCRSYPNAGFHKRLVQLSMKRALRHPLSPLPMFRW